jgi:hypothetical protein
LISGISGSAVVVGTFRSRDGSADRWVLVANRSHSVEARATLTPNAAAVSAVGLFDPRTQTYAPRGTGSVPLKLAPGAATLLKLHAR